MYGPILKGKTKHGRQFVLRPPTEDDAPLLIRWMADPEVTRTLGRIFPMSLDSEREWLSEEANNSESVIWIIECKHRWNFVPIGIAGIHEIDSIHRNAVTSMFIGEKSLWDQGIATAVMELRINFTFTFLGLHKLKSSFLEGNEGSRRAQKSAGYQEVGRNREEFWRDGQWVDEILTEVLAADWFAANRPVVE